MLSLSQNQFYSQKPVKFQNYFPLSETQLIIQRNTGFKGAILSFVVSLTTKTQPSPE